MDLRCRVYTDFMDQKCKDEGVGELPENSWTSLASSVIINRGLWLVSRSQTLAARVWLYVRLGCGQVSAIWK